jgi:hypothetical protein
MVFLTACGSISTKTLQPTSGPAPQSPPESIVVLPFEAADCQWGLEVSSADEAAIKSGFPDLIAASMVAELNRIAPTTQAGTPYSNSGWLVQGRLKKVFLPDPNVPDSKRKPSVRSTVFVFDLSRSRIQPFLTYDIVAKDVSADPLAESSEKGSASFLSLEARESARLLTQSVQDYLKKQIPNP